MSSTTNYLITGANRGIGLALVQQLASRANTLIFATTRNPSASTELQSLASKHKNIHILKLESTSEQQAQEAALQVTKITGHLDVIIANAGIAKFWNTLLNTPLKEFKDHWEVNVLGPIILFQSFYPLLKKSKRAPKFVVVSSVAGIISEMLPFPHAAYGSSKAAVNFVTKKISQEHAEEGIIAFAVHPGVVTSDMGDAFLELFKLPEGLSPITPEESAIAQLKVIDGATSKQSGGLWSYDGTVLPY